jgi:hypothetical protein
MRQTGTDVDRAAEAQRSLAHRLAAGALILVAGLLTTATLAGAAARWLPVSSLPEGYVVHMCGGIGTGRVRAGVWWMGPKTPGAPRWAFVSRSFPSCAFVPWLPILPQHGNVTVP